VELTCEECDKEVRAMNSGAGRYAPYRIGNRDIGWGTIVVIGCPNHVKVAFERLNRK